MVKALKVVLPEVRALGRLLRLHHALREKKDDEEETIETAVWWIVSLSEGGRRSLSKRTAGRDFA